MITPDIKLSLRRTNARATKSRTLFRRAFWLFVFPLFYIFGPPGRLLFLVFFLALFAAFVSHCASFGVELYSCLSRTVVHPDEYYQKYEPHGQLY